MKENQSCNSLNINSCYPLIIIDFTSTINIINSWVSRYDLHPPVGLSLSYYCRTFLLVFNWDIITCVWQDIFTYVWGVCNSFCFWYNEDTKRAELELDSDVDRWKDGGLFTVYITPLTLPKLERCYFFVLISISLTMSATNETSKVAKEHTNVNAS